MKKIKLNTVKSKMVAGVAAVTLFSGVGFVAANTDAGGALQGWYNKAFLGASADVTKDVTDYGKSKIGDLTTEYNGLKNDATNSINSKKDTEEKDAKDGINSAKQNHIDSINRQEAKIAAYMDDQFNLLSFAGKGLIETTGNGAKELAYADLKKLTEANGGTALKALEDALNTESENAVSELEKEIADAKQALLDQLKIEQGKTTDELKAAVDKKIVDLRDKITKKKDELVKVQTDLITKTARDMELAAKSELDKLVTGINK